MHIAYFIISTVIFDHFIRMKNIAAYLASPLYLFLAGVGRISSAPLVCAVLLHTNGFSASAWLFHGCPAVRSVLLANHHYAGWNMRQHELSFLLYLHSVRRRHHFVHVSIFTSAGFDFNINGIINQRIYKYLSK